jgi:hypothetical protein
MMPIEVEGPDGRVHTFADGTTREDVRRQMTTVYGGANAKGLPAAGASTPTAGAMMPSSQTVPPYFSAEDDENLLMAKVLGGPRAVADAIQRTPGHTYRTEQAKKVAEQQANVEGMQRTGSNVLRSYAQLLNKFNKADDPTLTGAIGPANVKPYSEYIPMVGGMTSPEATAAYWWMPKWDSEQAKKAWNLQNLLMHDVHGLTNAFMTGAGKGLNMSDKRQEVFESAMKDFMRATDRKSAKEILDHAKGIISNDFGIPMHEANRIVDDHLKELQRNATVSQMKAMDEARRAISSGAPRDAVIKRMRDNGYDPSGL